MAIFSSDELNSFKSGLQTTQKPQQSSGSGGILGFLKNAIGGVVNPIVHTAKNIVTDAPNALAQDISYLTGQTGSVQDANSKLNSFTSQTLSGLSRSMAKATDPAQKARYAAAIKQIAGQNTAEDYNNNFVSTAQKATAPKKTISNAADAANAVITLGTLGAGAVPGALVRGGLKQAVGTGIKQGLAGGAAYGALAPLQQGDTNPNDILTDALTSAGVGAVTGGALGAGSGILAKVAPGIKTFLSSGERAEPDAVQIAKSANGIKNPIASSSAAAKKYSTNLLANKLNIKAGDAQKFRAPETIQTLQDKYGLTPVDAAKLHPIVTGSEGASTEALNNSLESVGNIKLTDFGDEMQKELNDPEFLSANNITPSQAKNLGNLVNKYHERLNPPSEKALTNGNAAGYKINSGVNAKAAMDAARDLEKKGYNNVATSSEPKNATGDLQLKMANFIKRRIYNSPEGSKALDAAKNETASQLHDIAVQSGNKKLSKLAQEFQKVGSFEDYRNLSAPFVNAKSLADITENRNLENVGNSQGYNGAVGTVLKGASKVASPVGGKILAQYAKRTTPLENPPNAGIVGGVAGTVAGNGILGNLARRATSEGVASEVANPPTSSSTSDTVPQIAPISTTEDADTSNDTSSNGIFSNPKVIQALLLSDIAETGGKNVSTLLALYNAFKPPSTTAQSTTQVDSAASIINQLQTLYSAAGNGQMNGPLGKVGGALENVAAGTGLNNQAATYNDEVKAAATPLARALFGETGNLSDTDIKRVTDALPQIGDSTEVANQKWKLLQNQLEVAQQTPTTSI